MVLREVTLLSVIVRISVAFLLGGVLGMERALKQRPAGLRTYMLVCLGACMIMLTNQYIYQVYGTGDPVRMGAQVVSGIGFLGAGTIMVTKHSQIRGLTTAAGLWSAAAVGLATGIGFYEAALIGAAVLFITLTLLGRLDSRVHRKTRYFDLYIELPPAVSLGMLINSLRDQEMTVEDVQLESGALEPGGRRFIVTLTTKRRLDRNEVLTKVSDTLPGVRIEVF